MHISEPNPEPQCQRIQVTWEGERHTAREPRLKIVLESHDVSLGWYTAASLAMPLHQLPLLEQALEDMRSARGSERAGVMDGSNIIPFPGGPLPC